MNYYRLEPEVAGGIGPGTIIDRSISPPRIQRLHYVFDGWLGDDLLAGFLCFIVTDRLADKIKRLSVSGAEFADVEVTTSPEFEELQPDEKLPKFVWLKVSGTPGVGDFGISRDNRLVVSESALNLLRSFNLSNCVVLPWTKD